MAYRLQLLTLSSNVPNLQETSAFPLGRLFSGGKRFRGVRRFYFACGCGKK